MAKTGKLYYCEKCGRTLGEDEFYTSKNLEKFPNDGKLPLCKKCLTMHVDNYNPETYLWILQDIDVPYIPEEWYKLLATYTNKGTKITGMTILGRYLSKMMLKQFKDYRWKDNDFLQELQEHKIEETMKRQGYDAQQIADAINKATIAIPEKAEQPPLPDPVLPYQEFYPNQINEDYFALQAGGQDDFDDDLTEEDRKYLRLKWGKAYKPEEWIALEQLYNDMMESYDIQTAGHIDILKKCCKTSLKADQLLDIGDVEGAQKMVRMYDTLMKSGKFTAAQNKAQTGEAVDSLSELFALCEEDGFIPRYYVDEPQDKVDRTLQDLQNYTKSLISEESDISNLIENAIKQIQLDKMKELESDADAASDDDLLEDELFEEQQKEITDKDFADFSDWEDEEADAANELQKKLENGEL